MTLVDNDFVSKTGPADFEKIFSADYESEGENSSPCPIF